MATRIIRTGRWIPDDIPTVYETYVGDGMTQITTVEPPRKEIECFHWEWAKPKQKSKKWVYNSIAIASVAGCIATLMIPVVPFVSVIVLAICLAWLGLVGVANK